MVGYIQPMKGDYSTGLNPDWLGLTPTPHPLCPEQPNEHNVRLYGSSILANIEVPFSDALGKTREELKEYLTGLVVGKDSSTAINAPLFSPVAIKSGNIVFSLAALMPSK